jgi:two-component system, LuxR family, sensor histidine kinase DctS
MARMHDSLLPAAAHDAGDRSSAASSWHWTTGRAATALIVVAVVGLLWILHRQDLEEHRTALVRDVLWIEQTVQANLDRDAESLRNFAQGAGRADLDDAQLARGLGTLLEGRTGLLRVVLLDRDGELRASAPVGPAFRPAGGWLARQADPGYRLARSTGKPEYTQSHGSANDHHFEVFVPFYRGGAHAGTMVGVYDVEAVLAGVVPWWLAQKHRVTIRDAAGDVLATKSRVEAGGLAEVTYQVPLDPPGYGLMLHVQPYGSGSKLARNVLAVAIGGLALAVLSSMWSLHRHVQRRHATERALRREHAFRKAMEDSLETGMRAVDLEGRIVYVNPAFCRMVGYSEAELIGHLAPQPYWPPEDRGRIEAAQRAARAAGAVRIGFEIVLMRRTGECFDALLYEAPLVDQGKQTGWMASILDITERKHARERARQQEEKLAATARLVTMGEMASAIAHELNQPLSAIASYSTGCLNVLETSSARPEEIRDALHKTTQQAERAGRIIRRIHDFVRKSEPTRTEVRVDAVIEEAVGFVAPDARKRGVRIVSRLAAGDLALEADPLLLQQVMLNLLRNGMDAMAATPAAERELLVTSERSDASVTVRVIDRGCGLAPEVARKLFEPFFTTKPEGMGMGLNICRSVIESHGGRVWAEPGPAPGTSFAFSLPLEAR